LLYHLEKFPFFKILDNPLTASYSNNRGGMERSSDFSKIFLIRERFYREVMAVFLRAPIGTNWLRTG